jgi:hypothetical protein
MKVKGPIIVIAALVVVLATVGLTGSVFQRPGDAKASPSDPGFVPSTGQLNLGYDPKLPSVPSPIDTQS